MFERKDAKIILALGSEIIKAGPVSMIQKADKDNNYKTL